MTHSAKPPSSEGMQITSSGRLSNGFVTPAPGTVTSMFRILLPLALLAACAIDEAETHPVDEALGLADPQSPCGPGEYDMLDWLTLDKTHRDSARVYAPGNPWGMPLYTVVEANRIWWLKSTQGDTWDVLGYDDQHIWIEATELGFNTPWACKPAIDASARRMVDRCVAIGANDRHENAVNGFHLMSSAEVQNTSGDFPTVFQVRHSTQTSGLGAGREALVIDYGWGACDFATRECDHLEQYTLVQEYGLVRWRLTDGTATTRLRIDDGTTACVADAVCTAACVGVDPDCPAPTNTSDYSQLQPVGSGVPAVPTPTFTCTTRPEYRQTSFAPSGGSTWGVSTSPSIDDTGRFVAFESIAENLYPGLGSKFNIFVNDKLWNAPSVLATRGYDGSPANNDSHNPTISHNAEARWIAFESDASNLVPGDTNNATDVFVYDRWFGTIKLVSVGVGNQPAKGSSSAPSISARGCKIAFESRATNLDGANKWGVFVRDHCAGTTIRASVDAARQPIIGGSPSINKATNASLDGRFVAFAYNQQIHVYDTVFDVTTDIASSNATGALGNASSFYPSISGDGHFVAFVSQATNLDGTKSGMQVYVKNRWNGSVELASKVAPDGYLPTISTDGRFVAFTSVGGYWTPYLYDTWSEQTITPRALDNTLARSIWFGRVSLSVAMRQVADKQVPSRITLAFVADNANFLGTPLANDNASDVFTRTITIP